MRRCRHRNHLVISMQGTPLVGGDAEGPGLFLHEPLSFWGGVKIETGEILDRHHPQCGQTISGSVLVMAESRGSSSASSVLAEMIRLGTAPAALILARRDPILILAALVAVELYGTVMPILGVSDDQLARLRMASYINVSSNGLLQTTE